GDLIAERFEIEAMAAAGGMARVYRARDRETGRVVAVKLLEAAGDETIARFAREAQTLADLGHVAIVPYVAHGTTAAAAHFLAMKWLEGESLEERLRRSTLDVTETIDLGRRIGEALGAAHRRGVIHGDVKPSNIFLIGGQVEGATLLDFGIARLEAVSDQVT